MRRPSDDRLGEARVVDGERNLPEPSGTDTSREDTNMCPVVVMWLAGIPGRRQDRPKARSSRSAVSTVSASRRLAASQYDRGARIVALDVPDREAILRVLEDCPEDLLELRATLLQEHVWLQCEGLA